jgi:N-acetylglutamate synthase-like GNAT family acetyltransferase
MMIRHASSGDIEMIIELTSQLGYDIDREGVDANIHLYEKLQGYVFVAEQNEKVIAYIAGVFIPLFHAYEMMFRITALCVHEKERSRGVGKNLVEKIEELCRKKECFYIEVTSGDLRKKEAHLFYKNLGYTAYKGKRFTKRLSV